jgi:hypothetical protein
MRLNIELDPTPAINSDTRTPARTMRVYESGAFPGAVSFYLIGDSHARGAGLRVDRDQLLDLYLALGTYLGETTP